MYSLFYGDQLIWETGREEITAYDIRLSEKENASAELLFTLPAENRFSHLPKVRGKELILYDTKDGIFTDDKEIFRGKIENIRKGYQNEAEIRAYSALSYLQNSVQRQKEYHSVSIAGFLEELLNNHNQQVDDEEKIHLGAVTVHDSNDRIFKLTNYESTWACIAEKLIDVYGGHIVIRRQDGVNMLDYLAESPNTCSQTIQWGQNLIDLIQETDGSEIATVLIPLGATLDSGEDSLIDPYVTIESVNDGKDYVENSEAIKIFGRKTAVVWWDDVTEPANLKRKGEQWVKDQLTKLSITAQAIDLSLASEEFEKIKMGDEVIVHSIPHGLSAWEHFPVTERDRYLDDPERDTITLGYRIVGGFVGAVSSEMKSNAQSVNRVPSMSSVLAQAKNTATNLIREATNGYVVLEPNQILVMDTPSKETAKKVWRFNSGGLGYSRTGYNGTYGLAMTMDGAIVADFITAGILSGIIVRTIGSAGDYTQLSGGCLRQYIANGKEIAYIGSGREVGDTETGISHYGQHLAASKDSRGIYIGIIDSDGKLWVCQRNYASGDPSNSANRYTDIMANEIHRYKEDHYGEEKHSGKETHSGEENHNGEERHNGKETHWGDVDFYDGYVKFGQAIKVNGGILFTHGENWEAGGGIYNVIDTDTAGNPVNTYLMAAPGKRFTIGALREDGAFWDLMSFASHESWTDAQIRVHSTLRPKEDNAYTLGTGAYRWNGLYAVNSTINTSDRERKKDIAPLGEKWLEFIWKLKPSEYRWKENESERKHHGFIAQDIEELMREIGIPSEEFAGFIKTPVKGKDGKEHYEYGLRLGEFLPSIVMALQDEHAKRLKIEERLEELEREFLEKEYGNK